MHCKDRSRKISGMNVPTLFIWHDKVLNFGVFFINFMCNFLLYRKGRAVLEMEGGSEAKLWLGSSP